MKKSNLWVELDSGRVYTRKEMCRILENCYGFDELVPLSEIWEYFCRLEEIDCFDIVMK